MEQRLAFTRSRDGTSIAYALSGEGPPLVRAGTWMTHVQHDWDSPVWSHWLRLMSERHTLVRYDPRGCGLSQSEGARVSFDGWVEDMAAVVDKLGLEQFPLFGSSQGAAVAVEYAARYPERVSQLILYAPLITGWHHGDNPLSQRWRNMEQLVLDGWGDDNLAFPAMFAHLFLPDGDAQAIRWYAQLQRKSCSKETAAEIMKVLGGLRLFSRLRDIKVPTLVIQVSGDQVIRPESAPGIAGEIADSEFVSIESKNHILLEDEPGWDAFMRLFRHHLPGRSPGRAAPAAASRERIQSLSAREQQILIHIARGLSNQSIADMLFISEKTVRNHITRIFDKLAVRSRAEAIVLARDLGLL